MESIERDDERGAAGLEQRPRPEDDDVLGGDASSSRPGGARPAREEVDPLYASCKARLGGTLLGKWHLDALLGVGGMAAVYAATHRNGSRVAVKMLHPSVANDEARTRFLREGNLGNSVGHPGVVQVLDEDVAEDGAIFLVMELLEGESLEAYLKRPGKLAAPDALAIGEQVLEVLDAAHGKGIVHRDVKPENVFLCKDGRVKLLDFGIARLEEASRTAGVTHHGFLLGTPAYMAPEQARGAWDRVDGRTDVWAVGATLFRALTGRTVHLGDSHVEVLIAATEARAPRVADVNPGVPALVASLVDRALSYEPADRWASAAEMLENLRAVHRAMGYDAGSKLRAKIAADTTVRMELPRPADDGAADATPRVAQPVLVRSEAPTVTGRARTRSHPDIAIDVDVDDATVVGPSLAASLGGAADTARDPGTTSLFDDTTEVPETVMDAPRLSERPPAFETPPATSPAPRSFAPPAMPTSVGARGADAAGAHAAIGPAASTRRAWVVFGVVVALAVAVGIAIALGAVP